MPRGRKSDNHTRKHVTTACIPCRNTKVKCDGNTPTCRNCECKGKDCTYRQRDDKRTIPLRIAVNLLARRVGSLSRYIRDHGLAVPAMDGEDQRNLKSILQALGFDSEDVQAGVESHVVGQEKNTSHPDNYSAGPPERPGDNNGDVAFHSTSSAPARNSSSATEPATFPARLGLGVTAERQVDAGLVDHDFNAPFPGLRFNYEEAQSGFRGMDQARDASHPDNQSVGPPERASDINGDGAIHSASSARASNSNNATESATFATRLGLGTTAERQEDTVLIDQDTNIPLFVNEIQHAAPSANLSSGLGVSVSGPHDLQQDEGISEEHPNTDSDEEFTNQLSWRLGRLQVTQDGQLRYFGSTSNLTLLDALVGVNMPSSNNTQKDTQEVLENANLNIEVDAKLEKYLLELYFAWQNPSMYFVDYETFWNARQRSSHDGIDSPYYSRSLVDAMCAMGAAYMPKYHQDLVTFPRTLSEFFGERARTLLESEFENPSLSTIQTLGILSHHEASSTRDTRGWLYSGMAMRLVFDLGLHLDMTSYVEKGIISTEECKMRRTIFWAAHLNEQLWGYYLGRTVPNPTAGTTVQKPHWNDSRPLTKWKPCGCWQPRVEEIYNPVEAICHLWVSLYDLMMPLTDVLYGRSEISKHALQGLTETTVARLYEWKRNLPRDLDVNASQEYKQYLPHVLILHMQYYQFMIHCHRPYISKHYIQPQPPQGPGPSHARRMCIESAISIVKVLTIYESLYGFRKANVQMVSFTFSAALILIFITVPSQFGRPNKEHTRYLGECFSALDEMGFCFENAKRTSTFLSKLQEQWHKRRRVLVEEKTRQFPDSHRQGNRGPPASGNGRHAQEYSDHGQSRLPRQAGASDTFNLQPTVDHWTQDYASVSEETLHMMDFMDPDLCNILLSEGIPRALI